MVVAAAGLTEASVFWPLSAPADTMWIQVRTMDGKVTHTVDSLSRLTKVEELRKKIQELFHVEPGLQRLFYRGKQVNPPRTFVLISPGPCSLAATSAPALPPRLVPLHVSAENSDARARNKGSTRRLTHWAGSWHSHRWRLGS